MTQRREARHLLSRARLPGTLKKTAASHAIREAVFKNLTFKYNQVLLLLEAKSGLGAIKKALTSSLKDFIQALLMHSVISVET